MSRLKTHPPEPVEFLDREGRLPGFAQRRLDSIIAKKKHQPLTREEARELSEMLQYIDRKSIELLKKRERFQRATKAS